MMDARTLNKKTTITRTLRRLRSSKGLVATVVLAFFTDFKGEGVGEHTARHTLKPVVTENGGMLMIEGRF